MNDTSQNIIERNKQFMADLYSGPFRGHAIVIDYAPKPPDRALGDFTLSPLPVKNWVPWVVKNYVSRVSFLEAVGHDDVPCAALITHTGVFASAFGCAVHEFAGSNPAALPSVASAQEADKLAEPDVLSVPMLARFFELATLVRAELGPDVPLSMPDLQSAFDIAAIIWNKEDLFMALIEDPDSVHRLVAKTHRLLKSFLSLFQREFQNYNPLHCPQGAWAPPHLGCSVSEDEVGSMSAAMFEEFSLPTLIDLSETFGGLFMHCCAKADHQYESFKKIPNLRGINRVFQEPGPRPAIEAFSGQTVFNVAWTPEAKINELLDMARPDTRFLFNLDPLPIDEAKVVFDRLCARCHR